MIGWDCADTYIWLMKLAQVASIGLIVGISCALLTGRFPSFGAQLQCAAQRKTSESR